MNKREYAEIDLKELGFQVQKIQTSNKKEADLLVSFDGEIALIEEKTKVDSRTFLDQRNKSLDTGEIFSNFISLKRSKIISKIISKAKNQLLSSSEDQPYDFRLIWFTSTGLSSDASYEQFMSTVYGSANLFSINGDFKKCFYYHNSDFFRHKDILDGAIVANANLSIQQLCLNTLSPRYEIFRNSSIAKKFGKAVTIIDPTLEEFHGNAWIVDSGIDRCHHEAVNQYLMDKYSIGPLQEMDMGYMSAEIKMCNTEDS